MKFIVTCCVILFLLKSGLCQPPKLYIHIVSHNEPTDNLDASFLAYNRAKINALQLAAIINSKNAKWNLQTSDGFVLGALQYDSAGTSGNDFFEIISNPPYDDNIEIDPRSKNKNGRNIADQWYLLDSCGANPSNHLGGFIYSTTNPSIQPIDWLQYSNPVIGNIYGNTWQCSLLCGAGSYPPHTNDLNDFGIFKPDTTTNFYQHNPARNLWCMGTGCAPVLDSLSNVQDILDLIRGQVDSIQNGLWPPNKFYVTRIMTNQREYGPMFFQKISVLIDSLNTIPSSQLQWATISETFNDFQSWQIANGIDHSQWLCGQTITGMDEEKGNSRFNVFPNPFSNSITVIPDEAGKSRIALVNSFGKVVYSVESSEKLIIPAANLPAGIYLLVADKHKRLIIKSRE